MPGLADGHLVQKIDEHGKPGPFFVCGQGQGDPSTDQNIRVLEQGPNLLPDGTRLYPGEGLPGRSPSQRLGIDQGGEQPRVGLPFRGRQRRQGSPDFVGDDIAFGNGKRKIVQKNRNGVRRIAHG